MDIAQEHSKITRNLSRGSCVTIGNFDGVHLGHRKLISRITHLAQTQHRASVVVTFCPHPLSVLVGPNTTPFITTNKQKFDLLESMGVDFALILNFTKNLASMSPENFVRTYLVEWLDVKSLVVGYDYSFGKDRKGNFELLQRLGQELDFTTQRLDPVIMNDAIISSTRIRDLIKVGDVWVVRTLLERFYAVRGKVVAGHTRGGRLLGFPTANCRLENKLLPYNGVYAIWVEYKAKFFQAVANIGYNPTFNDQELSVEVHLLDFSDNLYGVELTLHFVQRLRAEKKFSNINELKQHINKDIALARNILATLEAQP
ncbi:FMN adenylyltransferase / Riboflavin kinase [Desulfovibrionales bacterium]